MDDCCLKEHGEGYSDLPYIDYDYFGSEYHDYDAYVHYYYFGSEYHDYGAYVYYYYCKVFEGIIKADAQRSDAGRFHSTYGQQVHWLGE